MAKIPGNDLLKFISQAKERANVGNNAVLNAISAGIVEDCAILPFGSTNLLYTTDFGPLVGKDIFISGKIAAKNAISDIFAMGGSPRYALALISVDESISDDDVKELLAGIYAGCMEEHVIVVGGHSIRSKETLAGLSVIGILPDNLKLTKQGAKVGDNIWITKPIGTGMALRAYYHAMIDESDYEQTIQVILQSDHLSDEIIQSGKIHAITDITGFGLIGHLSEMLGNDLGAKIKLGNTPILPCLDKLSPVVMYNKYILNNYYYALNQHRIKCALDSIREEALFDPQINGGFIVMTAGDTVLDKKQFYLIGTVTASTEICVV